VTTFSAHNYAAAVCYRGEQTAVHYAPSACPAAALKATRTTREAANLLQ